MITKDEIGMLAGAGLIFVLVKGKIIGSFIIEYARIEHDISSGLDIITINSSIPVKDTTLFSVKEKDEMYAVVNGVKVGPFEVSSLSRDYRYNIFGISIKATLEKHHKISYGHIPLSYEREKKWKNHTKIG